MAIDSGTGSKREPVYTNELITVQHLEVFKEELLGEIRKLMPHHLDGKPAKKWIKTRELRKIVDISPNTLHMLRVKGQLAYSRVGGVIYYDQDDIDRMFQNNKRPRQ